MFAGFKEVNAQCDTNGDGNPKQGDGMMVVNVSQDQWSRWSGDLKSLYMIPSLTDLIFVPKYGGGESPLDPIDLISSEKPGGGLWGSPPPPDDFLDRFWLYFRKYNSVMCEKYPPSFTVYDEKAELDDQLMSMYLEHRIEDIFLKFIELDIADRKGPVTMKFCREKGSCFLIQRLRHDEKATFPFITIDFTMDILDCLVPIREMHPNIDLIEEIIVVMYCIDQSDVLVPEGESPYSTLLNTRR